MFCPVSLAQGREGNRINSIGTVKSDFYITDASCPLVGVRCKADPSKLVKK